MPKFHSDAAIAAGAELDAFTAGYIEAIYFTETGDSEQPDSEIEMSAEAIATAVAACTEFQTANAGILAEAYARIGYDETRAGHDLWYTRNGHGVGYWSRDELEDGDLGERLSEAAKLAGVCDVYEGDDGLLY